MVWRMLQAMICGDAMVDAAGMCEMVQSVLLIAITETPAILVSHREIIYKSVTISIQLCIYADDINSIHDKIRTKFLHFHFDSNSCQIRHQISPGRNKDWEMFLASRPSPLCHFRFTRDCRCWPTALCEAVLLSLWSYIVTTFLREVDGECRGR